MPCRDRNRTRYQCSYYFDDLLNIIATVRNSVQPELAILGVLLTKHDSRRNVCQAVFQMVQDRFKGDCLSTTISMSTAAQKAELQRDTVLQYDRKCSPRLYCLGQRGGQSITYADPDRAREAGGGEGGGGIVDG
jgi:cellulose biosynthesis protein BcsQ